jgi:hypothetical protein
VTVVESLRRDAIWVWVAFVAAHFWLGFLNQYSPTHPMGDVTSVYKYWVARGIFADVWVGIDTQWVYPIVALVPMLAAWAFGEYQYAGTWLGMVMVLNLVAFGVLTAWGRNRDRLAIAWWWVAFLFLVGPIALGRIDAISLPLAVIAVVILAHRPRVAAVLLTLATWIKIWPAAIIGAVLIASPRRWPVVLAAASTSAVIIVVAIVLGGGNSLFSFVAAQTGRGLQVESPVSTIWMWMASAGIGGTFVYYDTAILTFQVQGAGSTVAAQLMTPLLGLAVLAIAALGLRAVLRRAASNDLLAPLSLAVVVTLIVFNKVGSPQFEIWLVAPIILGLLSTKQGGRSFRLPAVLTLVIAALTQVIYPTFYDLVLQVNPLMLLILSARNCLLVVLLAWAVVRVVRVGNPSENVTLGSSDATHLDTARTVRWPLHDTITPEVPTR